MRRQSLRRSAAVTVRLASRVRPFGSTCCASAGPAAVRRQAPLRHMPEPQAGSRSSDSEAAKPRSRRRVGGASAQPNADSAHACDRRHPARCGASLHRVMLTLQVRATADWPQFLGPDRNGFYRGAPIVTAFPAGGPAVVWRKKIGQGLSGPVVVGSRVILFHRVGDREVVESLDARDRDDRSGRAAIRRPTATISASTRGRAPCRSLPTGSSIRSARRASCAPPTSEGGDVLWSHKTAKEFGVPKGFFGAAGSPLVEGGRVIANIGGAKAGIIAFDARKGSVAWTATDDAASYSSPVGATIARTALRRVPDPQRPGGSRSRERRGQVPAALARACERLGQRRDAARRRQPDLRVGRIRARGGGAAARRIDADRRSGRRTRCCRITTRPACIRAACSTGSTAARSTGRACARSISRAAR